MKKYIVPVVYIGKSNFSVEAENPEEAKQKAKEAYHNAQNEVFLGNEYEDIRSIEDPEEV